MDTNIETILKNTFNVTDWTIKKPSHGLTKETYIAQSSQLTVFFKFDINIPPLQRVSNLGLAPKLLSSGTHNGRTYIIQEFVKGIYPDRIWINNNLEKLAEFIKTYHTDKELFEILKNNSALDYQQNTEESMRFVTKQLETVKEKIMIKDEVRQGIEKLIKESRTLNPVDLTPTCG